MAVMKHPIREAERYLDNARSILSEKAEKQNGFYKDSKYVKMAGNTAWNGLLVALNAVLRLSENIKKEQRLSYQDFEEAIARRDRKMPAYLKTAYEILHKSMGYDGIPNYMIVQKGLEQAKILIAWCDKHYLPNE